MEQPPSFRLFTADPGSQPSAADNGEPRAQPGPPELYLKFACPRCRRSLSATMMQLATRDICPACATPLLIPQLSSGVSGFDTAWRSVFSFVASAATAEQHASPPPNGSPNRPATRSSTPPPSAAPRRAARPNPPSHPPPRETPQPTPTYSANVPPPPPPIPPPPPPKAPSAQADLASPPDEPFRLEYVGEATLDLAGQGETVTVDERQDRYKMRPVLRRVHGRPPILVHRRQQ